MPNWDARTPSQLLPVCPILSLPPSLVPENQRKSTCLCGPRPAKRGECCPRPFVCKCEGCKGQGEGKADCQLRWERLGSLKAKFWRVSSTRTLSAPHTPLTSASLRSSWLTRSANWASRPPQSSSGRARSRRPTRAAISPQPLRRSAGRWGAEVRGENRPAVSSARGSADAPAGREVGRFQESASAGAPRSGRFLCGASPGAGLRSCSSSCACSVGCRPGNLVGKGGREGGGGRSPALWPHPPHSAAGTRRGPGASSASGTASPRARRSPEDPFSRLPPPIEPDMSWWRGSAGSGGVEEKKGLLLTVVAT